MNNQQQKEVVKALMVAYEVMGKQMSEAGATMVLNALKGFEFNAVMVAIHRTASESSFINPKEIISRIDDGRPDPEKAWALCSDYQPFGPYSECITEEQSFARGVASHLINENQLVSARMAFVEEYKKLCAENRAQGLPVKYVYHFGTDKESRLDVIKESIELGRITKEKAVDKLPEQREDILNLPALPSAKEAMSNLIGEVAEQVRMN